MNLFLKKWYNAISWYSMSESFIKTNINKIFCKEFYHENIKFILGPLLLHHYGFYSMSSKVYINMNTTFQYIAKVFWESRKFLNSFYTKLSGQTWTSSLLWFPAICMIYPIYLTNIRPNINRNNFTAFFTKYDFVKYRIIIMVYFVLVRLHAYNYSKS